ncbi:MULTISPECIES: RDD family protein [Pseudoalteromonas]|uniref:RDD family protein n=1 Tax=Pseudoalteromonas TaxID=53246 RepID=UPI000C7CBE76|nr:MULTISPECIES: RDD family protein [unclassified Pseudoalteromonas]AUJ69001.1 RDD family protein [Pseudoalteromonas sp. NC201]MCF2826006.1 RDD family protein [Pseudoalteromonas sp. OF5H-5]MCF2830703.1 RDD family protein [Pseudoalteromonas sp. DL2-H6]MCF2927652.1 RDD family protein [Pseudoalteromonas sp. DL2-H1]MCF7515534.1 RDD family protein [Pseudoalteromonas sp. L7]
MSHFAPANFSRRLASLIYDSLVVVAFAMLTTVLFLLTINALISFNVLTLGNHEDVSALIQADPILYTLRATLLVLVSVLFFAYFWTKSGQTIGMRAWRLKVQNPDGALLTWPKAIARSLCALLGLGNLIVLLDFKKKRSLQDMLCGTEVVVLSKEENKKVYNSLD